MSKRLTAVSMTGVLLAFLTLAPRTVCAQSATSAQFPVKNTVTSTAGNNGDTTSSPSLEVVNARIRAQQMEISELREQVRKLEAILGATSKPVAENVAVKPTMSSVPVQNPPAQPPPIGRTSKELLPGLGQIGAEVGLLVGGSQNPFDADSGFFAGGFIDLPLKKVKGGKLSYEIMIGAQRTISEVQTTSGVIALVNSALNSALGTPPSTNNLLSPLPVTNRIEERLTILTVVPASFKYTSMALDEHNIRPYAVVGLGTYVGLSNQKTADFDARRFISDAATANLVNNLLNGAQVGGLIPIAPELRARGVSQGQGDFRFGLNVGGGIEFRLSPRFSLGFDYRLNKIEGTNGTFSTFASKPTVHF